MINRKQRLIITILSFKKDNSLCWTGEQTHFWTFVDDFIFIAAMRLQWHIQYGGIVNQSSIIHVGEKKRRKYVKFHREQQQSSRHSAPTIKLLNFGIQFLINLRRRPYLHQGT